MGEEYFKIKKMGKTLNIKILKRCSAKKSKPTRTKSRVTDYKVSILNLFYVYIVATNNWKIKFSKFHLHQKTHKIVKNKFNERQYCTLFSKQS